MTQGQDGRDLNDKSSSCEILSALLNEKSFWHYKGANHINGPFSHYESNTDIKGGPSTI